MSVSEELAEATLRGVSSLAESDWTQKQTTAFDCVTKERKDIIIGISS